MTEPAALRRRLTVELKRLRNQARLTQRQVADSLDWSPSKVIRIEQGLVRVGVTDLHALLALYGVTDRHTLEDLTVMARGSKKLPFAEYRDVVSPETFRYFGYEASASTIRQVILNVLPGLLQTEEYARTLFSAYGMEKMRADKLIESRKERQELFDRFDPPEMYFMIDESALRRAVGGPTVMSRQIDYLTEMARRPHVSIYVLPFALGAHAALPGPFVHLEFPSEKDPDVIYVENALGDALFHYDLDLTASYLERFLHLEDVATRVETFEDYARA